VSLLILTSHFLNNPDHTVFLTLVKGNFCDRTLSVVTCVRPIIGASVLLSTIASNDIS
jgi:hypothetical protein